MRVELAAKRGDPDLLTSALASAGAAAERAAIPALVSEVARIRDRYEGLTAVITSRGQARTASFCEVCALGRSADVVVDGGGRELRSSGECVAFARRPVPIHQIDATSGKVLKTLRSDRFVTGVSFVDGDLWHSTWEGDTSELRRVDPATGRVLEALEMPDGVSGLEAKGDVLFRGGIKRPVVRAVKRPSRK